MPARSLSGSAGGSLGWPGAPECPTAIQGGAGRRGAVGLQEFFSAHGDGALAAEGWNGLWGLLTTITLRKCADRARFHRAESRDISREATAATNESAELWREAAGREPTPDQAAVLAETVEGLLSRLDVDERTIVEMSLQGCSTQEISEQTGRAERSVRRIRESIRKHLERQQLEAI